MRTIQEIEAEIKETQEAIENLRLRLAPLNKALVEARIAADAGLKRCTMVMFGRGGKEVRTTVGILRKTPAGWLIVRPIGGGGEYIYVPMKPPRHGCTHRKRGLPRGFSEYTTYLTDVPKEFL